MDTIARVTLSTHETKWWIQWPWLRQLSRQRHPSYECFLLWGHQKYITSVRHILDYVCTFFFIFFYSTAFSSFQKCFLQFLLSQFRQWCNIAYPVEAIRYVSEISTVCYDKSRSCSICSTSTDWDDETNWSTNFPCWQKFHKTRVGNC